MILVVAVPCSVLRHGPSEARSRRATSTGSRIVSPVSSEETQMQPPESVLKLCSKKRKLRI